VGGVETVECRIMPAIEPVTSEMLEFVVLIFTALQEVRVRVPLLKQDCVRV
jgi:hypothetical protein